MTEIIETKATDAQSPKLIGLCAGLIAFAVMVVWFKPESLDRSAQLVAAVGVLMAIW